MKKITICHSLIFCPLLAIANEAISNKSIISSHLDMIASIQNETANIENKIKYEINRQGNYYNIDYDYYKFQRKAILERCLIYATSGGQRAEILENQCELDEVTELYNFINIYIASVVNS